MREIIFQGKRVDNGKWIEGYLLIKYFQEIPHDRFVIQYKPNVNTCDWTPAYMVAEVDPKTVRQFTGLYDSTKWEELSTEERAEFLYPTYDGTRKKEDWKGKPIFEGDILTGWWDTIFQVVYDNCYLGFRAKEKDGLHNCIDYYGLDRIKIIGNKHDNPELL